MIDRRELLHRAAVMLGGAVSSSAVLGVLGGCAATPQTAEPVPLRFFTPPEAHIAEIMAGQIIPATDTPGAIETGVPAFIDRMMADFYQDTERATLRAGLARADADAQARHTKPFHSLTSSEQIALMTVYDREQFDWGRAGSSGPIHFFRIMKELTTLGFFTSEIGASKFLRYDPVPGPYRADLPYDKATGRAWST